MNTTDTPPLHHTGVVILAAGAGRRMGGRAKCLLEVEGQSLLARLVDSVHSLGLGTPVVVLGHHAADIRAHLAQWPEHLKPRLVTNPAPEDDPGTSLHLGLGALDPDAGAVMVLLADQPLIGPADIGAVLSAFDRRSAGRHLLVPSVNGVPGHPVMFDATVRGELLAAPGTRLRHWRAAHPGATLAWEATNPAYTRDLDTPDDLATLARETGWTIRWPEATRASG